MNSMQFLKKRWVYLFYCVFACTCWRI